MFEVVLFVRTRGEEFEVSLDRSMTIGRSNDAALPINDDGLSRIHSNIFFDGERVWITDENSTNGTYVNGQAVSSQSFYLKDGDQIEVGNYTKIEVIFEKAEEPKSATQQQTLTPQTGPAVKTKTKQKKARPENPTAQTIWTPTFLAVLSTVLIAIIGIVAFVAIRASSGGPGTQIPTDIVKGVKDTIKQEDLPELNLEDAWDVAETAIADDDEQVVSDADWKAALAKAKEPRNGPTGLGIPGVVIPQELQQYPQRGRFLAIQSATAIQENLQRPHDYAELSMMVSAKQLVELKPVGKGYVIYAIAGGVDERGLTHFEKPLNRAVPLYRSAAEYSAGLQSLSDRSLVENFYRTKNGFALATSEINAMLQLAQNFNGVSFDLNNGTQRKFFRRKLLSYLHPKALQVLEELGSIYQAKFGRPLAVSSLVRTHEYQVELSKRNTAAAKNDIPPHTTGCAVDLSYGFMTAEEQNFLMAEIAKMERAGRVEALRENNNCYHIFIFPNGQRPPENVIKSQGG